MLHNLRIPRLVHKRLIAISDDPHNEWSILTGPFQLWLHLLGAPDYHKFQLAVGQTEDVSSDIDNSFGQAQRR